MISRKFRDDISNVSGVIVLTDRQTKSQTDTTENNTSLAARMLIDEIMMVTLSIFKTEVRGWNSTVRRIVSFCLTTPRPSTLTYLLTDCLSVRYCRLFFVIFTSFYSFLVFQFVFVFYIRVLPEWRINILILGLLRWRKM